MSYTGHVTLSLRFTTPSPVCVSFLRPWNIVERIPIPIHSQDPSHLGTRFRVSTSSLDTRYPSTILPFWFYSHAPIGPGTGEFMIQLLEPEIGRPVLRRDFKALLHTPVSPLMVLLNQILVSGLGIALTFFSKVRAVPPFVLKYVC